MYEITGRPPQATGLGLADLIEPFEGVDRIRFAEIVGHSLREKTGYQTVLRLRRPDGTLHRVEVAGDVMVDGEQLLGFVGLMREVSQSDSVAPSGDNLERAGALVKAMPIPAVLTDPDMRVLAFSNLWARSHGVASGEIVGHDLIEVVPRAPVGWALEHAKVVAGQTIIGDRTFHNPLTGRPVKSMANLCPWYGEDGAVQAVITMIGWSDLIYATKEIAAAMKGRVVRG
jgi:PAS domain-containing protein